MGKMQKLESREEFPRISKISKIQLKGNNISNVYNRISRLNLSFYPRGDSFRRKKKMPRAILMTVVVSGSGLQYRR